MRIENFWKCGANPNLYISLEDSDVGCSHNGLSRHDVSHVNSKTRLWFLDASWLTIALVE